MQTATAVARLRSLDLVKPPGVAELIDWVSAFTTLGVNRIDAGSVALTWGAVIKNRDDLELVGAQGGEWLVASDG